MKGNCDQNRLCQWHQNQEKNQNCHFFIVYLLIFFPKNLTLKCAGNTVFCALRELAFLVREQKTESCLFAQNHEFWSHWIEPRLRQPLKLCLFWCCWWRGGGESPWARSCRFSLALGPKLKRSPKGGGQLPNTRRPGKEKRTRLNLTPGKKYSISIHFTIIWSLKS